MLVTLVSLFRYNVSHFGTVFFGSRVFHSGLLGPRIVWSRFFSGLVFSCSDLFGCSPLLRHENVHIGGWKNVIDKLGNRVPCSVSVSCAHISLQF